MSDVNRIVLEVAPKKSFASALDWPGWSRSGKTRDAAIQVLTDYAPRYLKVAEIAGIDGVLVAATTWNTIDEVSGNGATEFGVPEHIHDVERSFFAQDELERQIALLRASWQYFDEMGERVSAEMQKGPRGGGRDRDVIVRHVIDCEPNYARRIGADTPSALVATPEGLAEHRRRVVARIHEVNENQLETKWPLPYFVRRAAWHVLDHAWEMEDKDLTGKER
ncbi:MAG: hypothetical protein KC435_00025 [Thermomicrobiales bacterium]|nr:hypothetical protein [Thermomicrobiales bacterium]